MVGALARGVPEGPALVLEDPRDDVREALRSAGVEVAGWSRRQAAPEGPPSDGSFGWVGMRLPRARAELEMLVHFAAGAAAEGAELWVYGANDEGVKSVARRLEPFFTDPSTRATGGHARVVSATRVSRDVRARSGLDDWIASSEVDLPWGPTQWWSCPGAFAHGRLDEGTALLLEHLPRAESGARVLDYGTGTGFLAAGMAGGCPDCRLWGIEPDGLAALAARRNVPRLQVAVGAGWGALPDADPFDVVVSNPPYHRGKAETLDEVDHFLGGLAVHLAPGGVARCVVQRRFPFEDRCRAAGLAPPRRVADGGPYRVWELRAGRDRSR